MNRSTLKSLKQALIVSTLALAGSAALADDITMLDKASVSTRSRAEVLAELQQARIDGTLVSSGELALTRAQPGRMAAMPLTREQVRKHAGENTPMSFAMLYGAP